MKKIFNLAVILASLMGAATFTSCDDDEDDVIDKIENGEVTKTPSLNVVKGGKYYAYQAGKTAFEFEVTNTSGSLTNKDQVVELSIKNVNGKKDEAFTLSDAGHSYLVMTRDAEGNQTFSTCGQASVAANAKDIVMCLALSNNTTGTDFLITSATINDTANKNGAVETTFAVKK